jgi:hypothetical protein
VDTGNTVRTRSNGSACTIAACKRPASSRLNKPKPHSREMPKMSKCELSVIMPVYNEMDTIAEVIERVQRALPEVNKELEPISKLFEEDNKAGKLDKAKEIVGVVLPANEDPALPLNPGEETLDEPASYVAA